MCNSNQLVNTVENETITFTESEKEILKNKPKDFPSTDIDYLNCMEVFKHD